MKIIRRLDSTGDTAVEFDETNAAATAEAERTISKMLLSGGVLFDVSAGNGEAKKVSSINDVKTEGLIVPRIAAG